MIRTPAELTAEIARLEREQRDNSATIERLTHDLGCQLLDGAANTAATQLDLLGAEVRQRGLAWALEEAERRYRASTERPDLAVS
jgi:hypothetical protein